MFAKLARSSLVAAMVFAAAPMVHAGALDVRDDAQLLAPTDIDSLRATAAQYPFSVRIFTTNAFSTREDLDRFAGSQVSAPSMVVLAVAPNSHWTSVHFGVATRIAPSQWRTIENAGDGYFRQRQWSGGMQGILATANASVGTGPAMLPRSNGYAYPNAYPQGVIREREEKGFFASGTFLLLVPAFFIGAIVIAAVMARRRQNAGYPNGQYPGGYRDPNAPYGGGPYYNNQGSGISPLGAGIAGAAVGGLAGYAIGRATADNDSSDYSSSYSGSSDSSSYSSDSGGSYDAGGSTSGWDSGGGGGDFGGGGGGGDW